jgi:antitoxin HicB
MKNKHIGSSFDDFLKEECNYDEVTGHAIKRVIAWQLAEVMKAKKISKSAMARRLKTSRTQVSCLLDPQNCCVQFDTMQKAASIIGKRLAIKLETLPRPAADSECFRSERASKKQSH